MRPVSLKSPDLNTKLNNLTRLESSMAFHLIYLLLICPSTLVLKLVNLLYTLSLILCSESMPVIHTKLHKYNSFRLKRLVLSYEI